MDENNGNSFDSIRFHRVTLGSTISPINFSEYPRAGPEDQANFEGAVRFADDESLLRRQRVSTSNEGHADSSAGRRRPE